MRDEGEQYSRTPNKCYVSLRMRISVRNHHSSDDEESDDDIEIVLGNSSMNINVICSDLSVLISITIHHVA